MGNHKEWRKLAKKLRRKRIRQKFAQERDDREAREETKRLVSPTYQRLLFKQQEDEEFQQSEEIRLSIEAHENWLRIEQEAQKQWQELQKRLELIRNERTKQQTLIKEQWAKEQEKLRKSKLEKEEALQEKLRLEQELQDHIEFNKKGMEAEPDWTIVHKCSTFKGMCSIISGQQTWMEKNIESYITNGTELPPELRIIHETNPGKATCPFFAKTAACRFRNTCSRNHVKPTVSPVLVIRNFYSHYSLDRIAENEHGSDNGLEFEHSEVYEHFKEFFHDVLIEMQKLGHVHQFKVCSNRDPHLRGNVYIEYESCRQAIISYRTFHGRFYAGKQITVEFCTIPSWKGAICGLFGANKCPKGHHCNFLHPFKNPYDMFRNADLDRHTINSNRSYHRSKNNDVSGRHWRWSESPQRNEGNNSEWDDVDRPSMRSHTKGQITKKWKNEVRNRNETNKVSRKRSSRSPRSSKKRSTIKQSSERKSRSNR